MTDTTAKIRAKGLDSTGVTEEIASTLYANKGKRVMAIVELQAVERHEKADGTRRVDLVLEQVEPATDDTISEHLRELTRRLYAARAQADGQQAIDDSLTPSLTDAIAAGAQHEPHPFLPTDAADDFASCEVCGLGENAGPHRAYSVEKIADPFEPGATDDLEHEDLSADITADQEGEPVPA
jgi:hypothetical protein